jgi:hypothetical protein
VEQTTQEKLAARRRRVFLSEFSPAGLFP